MKTFRLILALFAFAFLPVLPAFMPAPAAQARSFTVPTSGLYEIASPRYALAADEVSPPNEGGAPVLGDPTAQEIGNLIGALGGLKSLGTLGIIALVIQILMLVMKSKIGNFTAGWQLTAVAGLSALGAIVQYAMVHNVGIGVAAFSGTALLAYQVVANQIIKKLTADKATA